MEGLHVQTCTYQTGNTAASPRAHVLAAFPRRQFNQAVSQDLFSSNTPSVRNVFYDSCKRPDAAPGSVIQLEPCHLHPEQHDNRASPVVPVRWKIAALPPQVTGPDARRWILQLPEHAATPPSCSCCSQSFPRQDGAIFIGLLFSPFVVHIKQIPAFPPLGATAAQRARRIVRRD